MADFSFLHALSGDSVETYTNRSFQVSRWVELVGGVRLFNYLQATVWSHSGGGSGKEEAGDDVDEDIAPEHAQWMKQVSQPAGCGKYLYSQQLV